MTYEEMVEESCAGVKIEPLWLRVYRQTGRTTSSDIEGPSIPIAHTLPSLAEAVAERLLTRCCGGCEHGTENPASCEHNEGYCHPPLFVAVVAATHDDWGDPVWRHTLASAKCEECNGSGVVDASGGLDGPDAGDCEWCVDGTIAGITKITARYGGTGNTFEVPR